MKKIKLKMKTKPLPVPEQVAYFELKEDETHIDIVCHSPLDGRFYVVGIRKDSGELVRYQGLRTDQTGLSIDQNGEIKEAK